MPLLLAMRSPVKPGMTVEEPGMTVKFFDILERKDL